MKKVNQRSKSRNIINIFVKSLILAVCLGLISIFLIRPNLYISHYRMVKNTKAYFNALSLNDYQAASEYLWVSSNSDKLEPRGSDAEWIEKFSLQEKPIDFRRIDNIRFVYRDGCPYVEADVTAKYDGRYDILFQTFIEPVPQCEGASDLMAVRYYESKYSDPVIKNAAFLMSSSVSR